MIVTNEDLIKQIDKDNRHDWIFKLPHKDGDYIFVVNKETNELTINHGKDRMDYCNVNNATTALVRVSQLLKELQNAPQ